MKLITKNLEEVLERHPIGSQDGMGFDAKVLVKYFFPIGAATWFVTEAEKLEDGDWLFYGFVILTDMVNAEWGEFLLSDLVSVRGPFGLSVERDLYAKGTVRDLLADLGVHAEQYA